MHILGNKWIGLLLMLFAFSSPLKANKTVTYDTLRPVICANEVYLLHGDTLYRPTSEGADSTLHQTLHDTLVTEYDTTFTTLFLTIHPTHLSQTVVPLCRYDSILYEGVYYSAPDTLVHRALTVNGCDSCERILFQLHDTLFRAQWLISGDSSEWVSDSLFLSCTPFTLYGINQSVGAAAVEWRFGDGDSCDASSVTHGYPPGTYQPMLIATSPQGCLDTAMLSHPIVIFQTPTARYLADPQHPSDALPVATLYNLSTPLDSNSRFKWLFQSSPDSEEQDTTLEVNPVHTWIVGTIQDSLKLPLVLIAYQDYQALPDSIHTCSDTLYDTITLYTDFLHFPNLVTPNGDGINDRFIIVNLVEFHRYPLNRLIIYDRWGHPVYDVENITREDQFWSPAETRSPDGTYYFVFVGRGENDDYSVRRQGAIEVIGSGAR